MSLTAHRTNPDTVPIPKKLSKIKKKKKNAALAHCNPNNLEKVFRKGKKKKTKSKMVNIKKANVASASLLLPKENELSKLKESTEVSSNWKNLQKNLPKGDEMARPSRPAFVRKNKQGQIITNQNINHPKAVTIGLKKKSHKRVKEAGGDTEAADTSVRQAGTDGEVWFDGVDPLLLEHRSTELQDGTDGQGLVKPNSFKGVTRILGMDCEMVGVGPGGTDSVLARVSIVNHFGHTVYDKFVSPRERVTDYRTAVSGVRPADLAAAPSFATVQKEVADLIQGRLLVGHALHHDLKVLFLDHPKKMIRDTSRYKPFKAAFGGRTPGLKALAERYLGVSVQAGEHSSVQDSQAAVRLYTLVRTDWEAERLARRKPRQGGKAKSEPFVSPASQLASESLGSRGLYCPSDSDDD